VRGRYGLWRVRFPSASAIFLTRRFSFLALLDGGYSTRSITVWLQNGCRIDRSLRDHPLLSSCHLMEWRSESWMFNDPCVSCGVRRLDHPPSQIPHYYQSPALPSEAFYECDLWGIVHDSTAGTVERAITRHFDRDARYTAPLPSPEHRKHIRERAGLTQEDLADELCVTRWTVTRWEKPAGYRNGKRMAGREPVGELRKNYSELLRALSSPDVATR
jgi:DNA-binding transcriptional regulator YiaG